VDREVVEDGSLIASSKPADLEAFSRALLGKLEAQASERAPSSGA
jgi:putative intracellular protease/amidase